MRFGGVAHVVAHARPQCEVTAVGEFGLELSLEAQEEVTLGAPVVGEIARGIFEHSNPHVAEVARAPVRLPLLPGMRDALDGVPVDDAKWQTGDLHCSVFAGQHVGEHVRVDIAAADRDANSLSGQ